MDAVARVFGDGSFLGILAELLLRLQESRCLGRMACACRRLDLLFDEASRSMVLRMLPRATCLSREPWSMLAALVCSLASCGRFGTWKELAAPLESALDPGGGPDPPWAESGERVAQANLLVTALAHGRAAQLLGGQGPLAMIPLQRRLLRRLCFDFGALRRAPSLARLTLEKARGTKWEPEVSLDLADVLNLRAYARTYVSDRPAHLAEIEEAVRAADHAFSMLSDSVAGSLRLPAPPTLRAHRFLGRTLASAAHMWLLGALPPEAERRLAGRWVDGAAMFRQALLVQDRAVELALREVRQTVLRLQSGSGDSGIDGSDASGSGSQSEAAEALLGPERGNLQQRQAMHDEWAIRCGRPDPNDLMVKAAVEFGRAGRPEIREPLLGLGACTASLAECWFCISAAARHLRFTSPGLLGIGVDAAAKKSRETFESALAIFSGGFVDVGLLERSIEYADALKDYGKLCSCFFGGNSAHAASSPLTKALRLHTELLGVAHPRTCNIRRLCTDD
mmetsp:Transcript_87632/g.253074  ORF Transcript_87632/g.253074 Transcript_87632/m.253074 type:complete len:509 (+) Transcript_87632:44-1570(+)